MCINATLQRQLCYLILLFKKNLAESKLIIVHISRH